jgi:hypothetical protein
MFNKPTSDSTIALRENSEAKLVEPKLKLSCSFRVSKFATIIFMNGTEHIRHLSRNTRQEYMEYTNNGTARFKKCKQLFEYKHLLLLRDIWGSKLYFIFKCCSFFKHQS